MHQVGAQLERQPHALLLRDNPRALPPLSRIYENDNPVEVEIGCGKGKFLIARAQARDDLNFLGIDVVWKWMKYGVERSGRRGLTNIRFIKWDAREVVKYGLQDDAVSVFHAYFPDPWPKRRHRKRRLINGDFLRLLHSRLSDEGLIELATDYEDYFLQMRSAVLQSGVKWRRVRVATDRRLFETLAKTNYELKYAAAGRTLRYMELQK